MNKTAIILGATGLTGSCLLDNLIKDDRYETIKLFSRSKIEGAPKKVEQFTGNLLELDQFKKDFTADEVYCCIGTTASKTPNKKLYKQIDYGIPVNAAMLCKENGIHTFLVISAMGANKSSNLFYNKTKGQMEHDLLKNKIINTYILRPSLIGGNRNEKRTLEKIGLILFKVVQPILVGKLKKYQVINAESIAKAMIILANHKTDSKQIITSHDIKVIAQNN